MIKRKRTLKYYFSVEGETVEKGDRHAYLFGKAARVMEKLI